jgi:hypothetical protein
VGSRTTRHDAFNFAGFVPGTFFSTVTYSAAPIAANVRFTFPSEKTKPVPLKPIKEQAFRKLTISLLAGGGQEPRQVFFVTKGAATQLAATLPRGGSAHRAWH